MTCDIVAVGKRRDGGTRYWCLYHKADATAKYGKPAAKCRASHILPVKPEEMIDIDVGDYRGGVGLWGAVPPVYDTTSLDGDRGIHVHARKSVADEKQIDQTFKAVRIKGIGLPHEGILVSEIDAIYYMVSSVFGYEMKEIKCNYCGYLHLDQDWFSVRPHRRHLCAACGKYFRDADVAIGNPICSLRRALNVQESVPVPSKNTIRISQKEFLGGIQIWGSNPAFVWTRANREMAGIHVHAFRTAGEKPTIDDTFSEVVVDDVPLNVEMVRLLMAQETLPSLHDRVDSADCPSCGHAHLSEGELSYTPVALHTCARCGIRFPTKGRFRKVVLNPMKRILDRLSLGAPRKRQRISLDLLPETL